MNNDIYVGGQVVDQWGTFKRNKRDIIKTFKIDNQEYNLKIILEDFYNKALVYTNFFDSTNYILISYNTIVAETKGDKFIIYGYYSQTTAKHINAFLEYFGIKRLSKKEIEQNSDKWLDKKDYIL